MAKPQTVHYTWDDYVKFPDDGQRYEIIDGELFVTAAPIFGHQYTSGELYLILRKWADARGDGIVAYAPVDVVLAPDTIVQPDLIWISGARVTEILGDRVTGIPDLVIEILSPSTRSRDRGKKSEVYARFGGREYWLVDPRDESVEIRRRDGDRFVTYARGEGDTALTSSLSDELVVVPRKLFRTFPKR